MTVRSQLGIYFKVAVTAQYHLKSPCEDLQSALFGALAAVISRHPILSVIPANTDTPAPHFVRLPFIDLDQVVTFIPIDERHEDTDAWPFRALERFLEQEHSRPFQYTTPLSPFWRLHILRRRSGGPPLQFTACFLFHHCLCDTKSALVFHEAVEAALNDGLKGESTAASSIVRTPDLPLLPPVDEFLKGISSATGSSAAAEKGEQGGQPANKWSGAVQSLPVQTRMGSLRLSADQTKRLSAASKQHGVSVTATLQSMLATAIFRQLPPEYTELETSCPVSLRAWLPPPVTADGMGCFVDTFPDTFHRSSTDEFSWDEARRVKGTIDQVMRAKRGNGLVEGLSRVPDFRLWLLNKMGHPRQVAWELSNVGRLAPASKTSDAAKSCQMQGVLFTQSAGATNAAIKVSAVTGRDERLTLAFTGQEGVVEGEMVARVRQAFESILQNEF
jgi:hypothetical protein